MVKEKFNDMNLSQRCTLLEQIAQKQSTDPVLVAFSDKIASDILLHKGSSETLTPVHVISVVDSLIKLGTVQSNIDVD